MRNTGKENKFSLNDKVMIMINPTFQHEPHSEQSLQYEYNMLENKQCKRAQLILRNDFVNVKF